MTAGGLIFGFLFLMLFQSWRNDTLYRDREEIRTDAIAGVALYATACFVMHLFTHNNYLFAFCAYNTASLMAENAKHQPKTWAVLITSVLYGLVYVAALLVGPKLAQRRAKRIFEHIKENEG